MDFTKVLSVLEMLSKQFQEDSDEHRAIQRAAEAFVFAWQRDVKSEFMRYLKDFKDEFSEEEREFFKSQGWEIEEPIK